MTTIDMSSLVDNAINILTKDDTKIVQIMTDEKMRIDHSMVSAHNINLIHYQTDEAHFVRLFISTK